MKYTSARFTTFPLLVAEHIAAQGRGKQHNHYRTGRQNNTVLNPIPNGMAPRAAIVDRYKALRPGQRIGNNRHMGLEAVKHDECNWKQRRDHQQNQDRMNRNQRDDPLFLTHYCHINSFPALRPL